MNSENTQKTSSYIGSRLSLLSKMGVRYEGVLYSVDSKESTISLARVRSFGTEDRQVMNQIPPCDLIFDHIVFKASDIKDLMVCELPSAGESRQSTMFNDPAIVSFSSAPPRSEPSMSIPYVGVTPSYAPIQRSMPVITRDVYSRGVGDMPYHRIAPPSANRQYGPMRGGRQNNYYQRRPYNLPLNPTPIGPAIRFESDYDFQTANKKFQEAALDEKTTISTVLTGEEPRRGGQSMKEQLLSEMGAGEGDMRSYYDKSISFFDSISCEDRPKGERNIDWRKERQTNEETFGPAAVRLLDNRRSWL